MSSSLLDTLRAAFSTDIIRKAALYLGEPETTVRKGLDAVIPISLAGIVNKVETSGADAVMSLAGDARTQSQYGNPAEHFVTGGQGVPAGAPGLIKSLFGDRFGAISNAVTSYTGAKGATTSSLFGSVVPFALVMIGRYIRDNNLSPSGLSSLLSAQKAAIWGAVPTGLNLAGLLGAPARPAAAHAAAPEPEVRGGNRWLMPVLLLLIAGGVVWWLMRGKAPAPAVSAGLDTAPRPAPAAPPPRESIKVTLPNGVTLDAYKGGIEDQLVIFLGDANAKVRDDLWFDFDDLNFEFGTAQIVPQSHDEVYNIGQILKAFPKAQIKLGGYTDAVGDSVANMKLSHDRAEAVRKGLTDAGVGKQVVDAEGYGSQFAKFPATAPEDVRIKDRHVSVSVRAK